MSDGTTCCEDKAEMGDRELGGRQSQGREMGSVVGGRNRACGLLPWTTRG